MSDYKTDEMLERYLDGQLSAEQRSAFQMRLRQEPRLEQELLRQGEVDRVIRRAFAAPAKAPAITLSALRPRPARPRQAPYWINPKVSLAAAAALFAIALAGWQVWSFIEAVTDMMPAPPQVALHTAYRAAEQDGFRPLIPVSAEPFEPNLGQALNIAPPAPDIQPIGFSRCSSFSYCTIMLLARVGSQNVIVFADRVENDTVPKLASESADLRIFRRQVGKIVLYEATPLDSPRLLDLFY